jgi:flagellar M-ring protein FliF
MIGLEQLERLWTSLMKLGPRRLAALGIIGLAVFAITGLGGYFLSRPTMETLYSGLDRDDISAIGSALKDADIPFDVSADGDSILVHNGQTAQARMLLAEKGLPHSPNAGYELFDKLGSLGLTSFMQEMTRVRVLEGELARTIQSMRGIKAARVHIVLPDEGSFRRTAQPPSASVLIRTESADEKGMAHAIRHLVASAVPGMSLDQVTVLSSDGTLLASGNEESDDAPMGMLSLERTVSQEIQDNINKTLTPYLGSRNFQVSVATRLNTDKKQTNETTYDPDSKVERSERVVTQNQTNQNSTNQTPTSVDQNIPPEKETPKDAKQSNEENQKRETTTNYELSSKVVTTVSGGYSIDNISIAVLVNRASLTASLGDKPQPDAVDAKLAELGELIASAAGIQKKRGDNIKVSAVDFVDSSRDLDPVAGPGLLELVARQSGTAINAFTVLAVTALLIWFGVRPATKAILAPPEIAVAGEPVALPGQAFVESDDVNLQSQSPDWAEPNLIEDLTSKPRRSPQRRLEQLVEFDEEQAVAILKQWIHRGGAA